MVEKYTPAYCEDLHSKIMDEFHKVRVRAVGDRLELIIDGIALSKIIGAAKLSLYSERPDAADAGKAI